MTRCDGGALRSMLCMDGRMRVCFFNGHAFYWWVLFIQQVARLFQARFETADIFDF